MIVESSSISFSGSVAPLVNSPQFCQFLFPGSHMLVLGTEKPLLNLVVVSLDSVSVSSCDIIGTVGIVGGILVLLVFGLFTLGIFIS